MRRFAFHRETRRGPSFPFCTLFTSVQLLSEHPKIERNRSKKVLKSREQSQNHKVTASYLSDSQGFRFYCNSDMK